MTTKIEMDPSVEDFFARIKELEREEEQERKQERKQDRKQEKSNMTEDTTGAPAKPPRPPRPSRPVIDEFDDDDDDEEDNIPLSVDELVYESAYNYDKSNKTTDEDEAPPLPSRTRTGLTRHSHKKYDDLEIVRFDDYVSEKKPYRHREQQAVYKSHSNRGGDASSSPKPLKTKYELSETEKRDIDSVINGLIGDNPGGSTVGKKDEEEEEVKPRLPSRRKTSELNSASVSSPLSGPFDHPDDNIKENKPQLPRRTLEPMSIPKPKPAVKPKSSTVVRAERLEPSKPTTARPKPPAVKPKGQWLKSPSTLHQGVSTKPNYTIEKIANETTWLESAKNNPRLERHTHTVDKPKVKPIPHSSSNTLSKVEQANEQAQAEREKNLQELNSPKLNHVRHTPPPPKLKPKPAAELIETIVLKKVRPTPINSSNEETDAHDMSRPKLKPAVPVRKPSTKIPEAMQASKKLKPPVPVRKPSAKVPEAISHKGNLKASTDSKQNSSYEEKDSVPEALKKVTALKPPPPARKPSTKQLEALEVLNSLKKKEPPQVKPKPRVVSESKQILAAQLKGLKSVKADPPTRNSSESDESDCEQTVESEESSDPRRAIIERVLQRSQTAPIRLPIADNSINDKPRVFKKASTFDSAQLQSTESLNHLTKTRSRGPKRRVPTKNNFSNT